MTRAQWAEHVKLTALEEWSGVKRPPAWTKADWIEILERAKELHEGVQWENDTEQAAQKRTA